jgi:hypothetical protein
MQLNKYMLVFGPMLKPAGSRGSFAEFICLGQKDLAGSVACFHIN